MKDIRKPRKRNKRSKFDPYIVEIKTLLDTGMSVHNVAEKIELQMDDIVDDNALYAFIKARGLRSFVTQGGTNKEFTIPDCRYCEHCMMIQNTGDSDVMICLKSKRMISKSCQTSPMWCELRKAERDKVKQFTGK